MEKPDHEYDPGGIDHTIPISQRDVSVARWEPKLGMAEVLVNRGKLWGSMGVTRKSKLFCHVEEAAYMVEQGSLLLLRGDTAIPRYEVYALLMEPSYGCSWDAYQIFCHLKRLGYIVGRHNTLWSTSSKHVKLNPTEPSAMLDSKEEIVKLKEENPTPANLTPASSEICVGGWSSCLSNVEGSSMAVLPAKHEILDLNTPDMAGMQSEVQGTAASIGANCLEMLRDAEACKNADEDSLRHVKNEERNEAEDKGYLPSMPSLDSLSDVKNVERCDEAEDKDCFPRLPSLFTNLKLREDQGARLNMEESKFNIMFDVHQPNGRFKKTAPGFPTFSLCIIDRQPPKQSQVHALGLKIGGRPLKFGSVDCGHVSIFSFSSCCLPTLL